MRKSAAVLALLCLQVLKRIFPWFGHPERNLGNGAETVEVRILQCRSNVNELLRGVNRYIVNRNDCPTNLYALHLCCTIGDHVVDNQRLDRFGLRVSGFHDKGGGTAAL